MKLLFVAITLTLLYACDSAAIRQQPLEEPISTEALTNILASRGVSNNFTSNSMVTFNEDADIFTDTTPSQSGINGYGITVGQQRKTAAYISTLIIESQLRLTQSIEINFQSSDLGCDTFGAGTYNGTVAASPNQIPNTVYPTALANQLQQTDVSGPGIADVQVLINANVLDGQCERSYNYNPYSVQRSANSIDFIELVLHEISHGLGFAIRPGGSQTPFIYERFLFARDKNAIYAELSDDERADSASKVKNIVFTGSLTNQLSALLLRDRRFLSFNTNGTAENFDVNEAVGSPFIPLAGISAPLVNLNYDTCLPEGNLAGKIVVLPVGCAREELGLPGRQLGGIKLAEREGALAVVVGALPTSFRLTSFTQVSIPVVSVLLSEYQLISQAASGGALARLAIDRTASAGANERGQPYVFSGPGVGSGVGILHYDPSVSVRNSTMVSRALQDFVVSQTGKEPLRRGLGFNLPALIDMGWAAKSCGNSRVEYFEQCDDGNTINGDGCEQNCLLPNY